MDIFKTLSGLIFCAAFSAAVLAQDGDFKTTPETRGGSFAQLFCEPLNGGEWFCFLFYTGDLSDTQWSAYNASITSADIGSSMGTCTPGTFASVTADVSFSSGSSETLSSSFACQ